MTRLFKWSCFNSTNYCNLCAMMSGGGGGGVIDFLGGLWAIQADSPTHLISDAAACLDSAGLCWEQGAHVKSSVELWLRLF